MRSQLRLLVAPSAVLVVGLACTAAVALHLHRLTEEQDAERFAYAVAETHDRIDGRIDTYIGMLESGAAMLAAVDLDLSAAEFNAFAQRLDLSSRYPGVQGVGYSIRVRRNAGPLVADMMRQQGAGDFRLWPEGPEGVDEGGERHAILYLEPMDDRNRAAIGYNMYSEPVRRATMERARDTGEPAASGPVELMQEITEDKQAGFLIYVPVYEGGDPGTLEERRERLAGFVYSPFRAGDLMEGVFRGSPDPQLHIALFDDVAPGDPLMHATPGAQEAGPARFSTIRRLDVAGRAWTVAYAPQPDFDFSANPLQAPLVFATGALLTLVLAGGSWQQGRTASIARRRTAELEAFNKLGAAMAAEPELEKLLQAVTDAGVALTGAQFGAFFYNAPGSSGGSYRLHTISGAPLEAFSGLPMPRNTKIFAPTFAGERIVRSRDVTQEPDFGQEAPHYGMPPGHPPVRSYLAAPVADREGKVVGGLFFGHQRAGRFDPRTERALAALAGQASIAIENARLWREMRGEIDHRKLLLDELNHRVKNTLATVQSMAAQTMRGAESLPDFGRAFESRLIALSSTHNLLTKGDWKGASLRDLAGAELAPFDNAAGSRVSLEGPDVWLRPAEATSLGMAFHELTTNAVKYGALSRPEGHVSVEWSVRPDSEGRRVHITWREHGGPPVTPPARRGFGSRLIERGLVGQHGGEARLEFAPEGLRCEIEMITGAGPDAAAA